MIWEQSKHVVSEIVFIALIASVVSANTDKGWAPVDDGTDVRIQSALTKKYIDYAFHLDYAASQHASSGSRKLHQWEISGDTPNQVVRVSYIPVVSVWLNHTHVILSCSGSSILPNPIQQDTL